MKGCIDKMVVSAKHALCYVALHCQEVGRVALVKMNGVISTVSEYIVNGEQGCS